MIVYLGVDLKTARKLIKQGWRGDAKFLHSTLESAIKKARKFSDTKSGDVPVVLELHYRDRRALSKHNTGYQTCRAPHKCRFVWFDVNGGEIFYKYPASEERKTLHDLRPVKRTNFR